MNIHAARASCTPGVAAAASLAVALAGCSDYGSGPPASTIVTAAFTGLAPGSPGEGHYELWISFALLRGGGPAPRHSEAASAGKFRMDSLGRAMDLGGAPITFEVRPDDPNAQVDGDGNIIWQLAADSFVTIEPEGDSDGAPNLPGIVGGPFVDGTSQLTMHYADAIDLDLSAAAGSFLLATPTTADPTDETEGIWFVLPGGTQAALELPEIRDRDLWTYVAWYRDLAGTNLAPLGGFRDPGGPDSDGAGPLGGSGYPFPGSDFPFGAAGSDLSAGIVFISLEPPFDADGPAPFFLRVLSATVNGVTAGTPVTMSRDVSSAPGGTVEIPVSL
jgi:hypothetical protein